MQHSVLLVIGGGISAYKTLDLIRRLRERGIRLRCVLTSAAKQFVTPLSVASLAGSMPQEELFDPAAEASFGHIELSRAADLVVVAPATADFLARMAAGLGSDLASALLLATSAPVLVAPAMNPHMWAHPATQRNVGILRGDGIVMVGPEYGDTACGELGLGRMAEPDTILAAIEERLGASGQGPLAGRRAVVTAGPTHEPVDPVRFLGNRSSGRQGREVAAALAALGAEVTLVAGPGAGEALGGCTVHSVETAMEMRAAVDVALPADVFVSVAAVTDWRPAEPACNKIKKNASVGPPVLELVANPDILAGVAGLEGSGRPRLVVGFAAETGDPRAAAADKRKTKGCDWVLANDVSDGVFGSDRNEVALVTADGVEAWPQMGKDEVARRLAGRIADVLGEAGDPAG